MTPTAFGRVETFADTGVYRLRMLHTAYGWRFNFRAFVGGCQTVVVAKGAAMVVSAEGHKTFCSNGMVVTVDPRMSCSIVTLEDSTLLDITHGAYMPEVDAQYVGWHIAYMSPNMAGGVYVPPAERANG